ncbi:MAG: 4'-phosphopantetheinyl transferase superfamily protein [Erysipelotrichaceae bacterium]|nr:4'-phosphopantetheinyl transferase superfamily protein [Erysipelotrichaceae bacterium]
MIRAIGVDMCDIQEVERLLTLKDNVFINHTFTQNEIEKSRYANNKAQYFASLFAGKEATFKALSSLHNKYPIDLRTIEIINDDKLYVNLDSSIKKDLSIQNVLISISFQTHYIIAMVVIE